jgi:hypothetical protein
LKEKPVETKKLDLRQEFFESALWYGDLDRAEELLAAHPEWAESDVYTAALLGNFAVLSGLLAADPDLASAKGGPLERDPLTYLCFSKFLRLKPERSEDFIRCAQALLAAGAPANTGFWGDDGGGRPVWESAIYGAAGVAAHAGLTRLLIEAGADPNDEETAYHVAESYDLDALRVLLESKRLNEDSLATLLLRKADHHDLEGLRLIMAQGADPLRMTRWNVTAMGQALRRDNHFDNIALLVADHLPGLAEWKLAAGRGRADVLDLFLARCGQSPLAGAEALVAACARADSEEIAALAAHKAAVVAQGGMLLAQFAGNSNVPGINALIELGVPVDARYMGDGYFGIAPFSTPLHVAAWKGWPDAVEALLAHGAAPNVLDGQGRSALQLAVKACVDSYWTWRRTPRSVEALLAAGARKDGLPLPCGYEEVDALLA